MDNADGLARLGDDQRRDLRGVDDLQCLAGELVGPCRPPGWNLPKSIAVKPRLSNSATARASPSAACISVDVVGARLCGQASRACGTASTMSAARPSVLSLADVTAMSPMRKRRE